MQTQRQKSRSLHTRYTTPFHDSTTNHNQTATRLITRTKKTASYKTPKKMKNKDKATFFF
jgi:hypothetical protein